MSTAVRREPWREAIEALLMAIVMAVFLKYFIVEAYRIPTGSMQPTLIGDDKARISDRILVDKLSYRFRAPKRWEVGVFRFPLDQSKVFVKRIAGVGPEELKIELGDVWVRTEGEPWRVARRPRSVQESMWKRIDLFDTDDPGLSWSVEAEAQGAEWSIDGRSIRARGTGTAAFYGDAASIIDDYMHGYALPLAKLIPSYGKRSGDNTVGDLRVEGKVAALDGTEHVEVLFMEGRRRYRLRIPGPAAPAEAAPSIDAGEHAKPGGALQTGPYRLPAGRAVRFAAQNLDDLLELFVDGEVVASLEIEPALNQASKLYVSIAGAGGDLSDLKVYRDVYYTSGKGSIHRIPADHYFMLGDNTQDSEDSREWDYVHLKATAELDEPSPDDGSLGRERILRGYLRHGENPMRTGFGDHDGPKTVFVDEWGERHWFRTADVDTAGIERAPFVPRDLIQGKAMAVFWPLDPLRSIYRLSWVN